jgi:hypothetical protein
VCHKHLPLKIHPQKSTRAKVKNPGIKVVLLLKTGAFVKEKYFQGFVLQKFNLLAPQFYI